MSTAEQLFHDIATSLPDTKEGKMFGALCIKTPNGKAFALLKKDDMVFKLQGKDETEAMQLKGAKVFDPMDGRPMNGWIQLSATHSGKWKYFAEKAMVYVAALKK